MKIRTSGILAAKIATLAVHWPWTPFCMQRALAWARPPRTIPPCRPSTPSCPRRSPTTWAWKFVLIPPGNLHDGQPQERAGPPERESLHKVTLTQPFYMQTTEVTLGQWQKVMGTRWLAAKRPGGPNSPVVQVSWFQSRAVHLQAQPPGQGLLPPAHRGRVGIRRPGGGNQGSYPWGEGIDCNRAMYANNSLQEPRVPELLPQIPRPARPDAPAPVMSFPPNAWGLYDMAGNVWEWVSRLAGPLPRQGPVS